MNKSVKTSLVIYGIAAYLVIVGLLYNPETSRQTELKYFLLISGLSIYLLYFGISWVSPSKNFGLPKKIAAIVIGSLGLLYSGYLLLKYLT